MERALAVKEVDCQNWEKRVQDEIKEQERMQLEVRTGWTLKELIFIATCLISDEEIE